MNQTTKIALGVIGLASLLVILTPTNIVLKKKSDSAQLNQSQTSETLPETNSKSENIILSNDFSASLEYPQQEDELYEEDEFESASSDGDDFVFGQPTASAEPLTSNEINGSNSNSNNFTSNSFSNNSSESDLEEDFLTEE